MSDSEFTLDEWMCVALARTISDGEIVFHGFGSPCAQVAMHVAKRTHAPHMVLIEGATYALDPVPAFIPPTSNDWSLLQDAPHVLRFEELFDLGARGDLDRMFLSGGQIDAHGNTNVSMIGPRDRPKVKLGGGGGGCNLSATVRTLTIWTARHGTGRTLVERCDFVTDMGHRTPAGSREELGFPGGGPEWMITDLGAFDFPDGRARLRRLYPDVDVEAVRAATGFELDVADEIEPMAVPSAEELETVRAVDPTGVRRSEFGSADLARAFTLDGAVSIR